MRYSIVLGRGSSAVNHSISCKFSCMHAQNVSLATWVQASRIGLAAGSLCGPHELS